MLARIATLIFLKSNLLTIERPAAAARNSEFPWANGIHGNSGTHELNEIYHMAKLHAVLVVENILSDLLQGGHGWPWPRAGHEANEGHWSVVIAIGCRPVCHP